jgi:HTH-type transcriptional regulator/antitoxin HigA
MGGRNSFMSIAKKLMKTLKEEVKSTSIQMDKSYHKLVALFPLQPIVTKDQHTIALKVIERVISFVDNETEDEGIKVYLKTLVKLVGGYERENYKSQSVTGREMLAYLMDLQGLTQKDLAKEVGGQPIVSKILKGERDLNIRQVKALAKRFKVSPEVFI